DAPDEQVLVLHTTAVLQPQRAQRRTLVGSATTGRLTRPATTPGSAPSIPATTMIARAEASRLRSPSRRCNPATPTSYSRSTWLPINSAVTAASSATERSDVPAVATTIVPAPAATSSCLNAIIAASV